MIRIAAIVVTHRADALLARCLATLAAQERLPDEVVVVVSGPRAEVDLGGLAGAGIPARVLQLPHNPGYAAACHVGADASTGELLLLNDDTELQPGCIAALARAWTGPAHVYQPRIRLAGDPSRLDNVGHGLFPDGACWALGRNGPDGVPASPPGAFSGAAVLVPREAWRATGGYDRRYGAWAEDLDLSLRLLRRGVTVLPVPEAIVHHHLGASHGRTGADKLRALERNRTRAALRSLPWTLVAALPATTTARYALAGALALAGRGPGDGVPPDSRRAAIHGMLEGMLEAPTWLAERARDRAGWTLGERETLRAMWERRARWEDLCRPAP